jgi:ketosteroid isomerase-like protein
MRKYVVGLLAIIATCPTAQAQTASAQAIRLVRERSNAAIANRDLAALRGTWVEDIHVTASSGMVFQNSREMERAFTSSFEDPDFVTYRRIPDTVSVSEGGGFGAEHGRWVGTWAKTDGEMNVRGVYLAQWQNREGVWRIRSEVFVALSCTGSASCADRR